MKENQIERMKNYIKFIESKMFTGKNLRMTHKKASRADLTKKSRMWCFKNRCARGH